MAFAPDGRTLATGSADKTVRLWDVTNRTRPRQVGEPLTGHSSTVVSVAFSPDSRILATGSADKTVRLWDMARLGKPVSLTGHGDAVVSVAFSPDGRTLATASLDKTVILWEVTDRAEPTRVGQPLTGHTGGVYWLAFAPDGRTLATGQHRQNRAPVGCHGPGRAGPPRPATDPRLGGDVGRVLPGWAYLGDRQRR